MSEPHPDPSTRPGLTRTGITTCESCGAEIRWATTQANRVAQPVDAEPHDRGNLACWWDAAGRLWSRGLTTDRPWLEYAEWRAMPHHASCTNPPRRRARPDRRRRNGVRPVPQQRKP